MNLAIMALVLSLILVQGKRLKKKKKEKNGSKGPVITHVVFIIYIWFMSLHSFLSSFL